MKSLKVFQILCFFSLLTAAGGLYAQENITEQSDELSAEINAEQVEKPAGEETAERQDLTDSEVPEENRLSPRERQRLEMEITSSTLPELAAWSRSLGLSESGTRENLSLQLREHFSLGDSASSANDNQKIITILSAQTTEYFKIEATDEDYARLKGDVNIVLNDNDTVHKIQADEILFNRTRNIITASGNVVYEKTKGADDTVETFRGRNITVNIDDWSSIFLDGDSEKKLESENTAYRFEGTVISRNNDDDTMILQQARISNANNPEALWSITASRLWLLPGSDFAIFNAVLNVGEIPVLYIPFFYYPADEIIFHPVLGYRSREGAFVHTTTYILGRPKADASEQSSLARILGNSNDMEKEPHGIFLRSTGTKSQDPNEITLKILADYYTNLGFYTGIDLSTPRTGILNPMEVTLGLGFSRTLSLVSGNYTPYAPNYDGTFDWNHSNLFSESVPFRYRFRINSSINARYGELSWDIPFYSDPYMDRDFLNRSENMDWMNMMEQGAAFSQDTTTGTEISQYQWNLSGRLNPSFPALAPYVSNISLSRLSTTLAFKRLEDTELSSEDPARFFFAPDKYTIYNASISISGTPLNIGTSSQPAPATPRQFQDIFKDIGTPRSPWQEPDEDETQRTQTDDLLTPPVLNQRFDLPSPGNVNFTIDYQITPTSSTELQFLSGWQSNEDVDWSDVQSILTNISGNAAVNFRVSHSAGLFSNRVTFQGSGTWRDYSYLNEEAPSYSYQALTGRWAGTSANYGAVLEINQTNWRYTAKNGGGLRGSCLIMDETAVLTIAEVTLEDGTVLSSGHPLIGTTIEIEKRNQAIYINSGNEILLTNEKFETDTLRRAREQQYSQTSYSTTYEYSGTVRPFYQDPVFGQTNIQYGFRGTLVRSKRYTGGSGPELTPQWGVWAKEETVDGEDIYGLTSHRISSNIAANIMNYQQNLSVSADLPPFDPLISTNATFRVWYSETNARINFKRPETVNNEPNDEWIIDPLHLTETLTFPNLGAFSFYMVLNPEEDNEITTITSSLSLWNSFRVSFSAAKLTPYEFISNTPGVPEDGGAWVQIDEEPSLHPKSLDLSYRQSFSNLELIKDRLNLTLNLDTALHFDLQRHTNSNFRFTMGINLGIKGILDLSLSATSENNVIFRYFKEVPGMEDLTKMYIDGPQNNLFIDLFDSFNFWDDSLRQRSGFKLKRFNLSATHYLGDWRATLDVGLLPWLDTETNPLEPTYKFNADVSFLVQWSVIPEIKTDYRYESRTESWTKR